MPMQIERLDLPEQIECCNEDCGWAGHVSEAVILSHSGKPKWPMCPICHEPTGTARGQTC